MENEEKTDGVQVEQQENQPAPAEEAVAKETPVENPVESTEETPETKLAKAQAEAAKYRRLFEKSQKPERASPIVSPQLNVEETVLLANGMPEELVAELKVVAQLRKTTLIKAQNDPIFVAVKEKFEKDQKQKGASLPASRGSGEVKAQKGFTTPGLTREEHKKLVKESQ
jgi:hypothetical protein